MKIAASDMDINVRTRREALKVKRIKNISGMRIRTGYVFMVCSARQTSEIVGFSYEPL